MCSVTFVRAISASPFRIVTALAAFREERGLPADPFAAFRASGYEEKVAGERVGGNQMGWGA